MEDVDVTLVSRSLSKIVQSGITCYGCCKYYVAPKRANCGDIMCHTCWIGCKHCPVCSAPVQRRSLKLDTPTQVLKEHVLKLVEAFEDLFNVTLEPMDISEIENDPAKQVKEWLASSQNHFSAINETQQATQDILPPVEIATSKIQIHTEANRGLSPKRVMHVSVPQDDWDKIEVVPDTEDILQKDKENVIGPMDFEPFSFEENEYSDVCPRRSNRKKAKVAYSEERTETNLSKGDTTTGTITKLEKTKQDWTNVKKMKKEFSKLNKNKLNVSIELAKKTQSKQNSCGLKKKFETDVMDDKTQNIETCNKRSEKNTKLTSDIEKRSNAVEKESLLDNNKIKSLNKDICKESDMGGLPSEIDIDIGEIYNLEKKSGCESDSRNNLGSITQKETAGNIPFIKRSTFQACNNSVNEPNLAQHTTNEEPHDSDNEIQLLIRYKGVGTNITINTKQKDVQLKLNNDREIQTLLQSNIISQTHLKTVEKKSVAVQTDTENYKMDAITPITVTKCPHCQHCQSAGLDKSESTKKNTASAETATATAQYLITDSVARELSSIMECEEIEEISDKEEAAVTKISSKSETVINNTQTATNINNDKINSPKKDIPVDLNLDDIDIFNSGSVKEHDVQMLRNKASSDILVPSHKSNKNRTQKNIEKRKREEIDILKSGSKRQKIHATEILINHESMEEQNKTSESPDYDQVMGQVFSNIDADIAELHSQTLQSTNTKKCSGKSVKKVRRDLHNTQNEHSEGTENKFAGEKFSENMFSTVGNMPEKGNAHVPGPETQQNIANLLTPGARSELASSQPGRRGGTDGDVTRPPPPPPPADELALLCTPVQDDDSDKSVVEDTPQKNVSAKTRSDSGDNSKSANSKKLMRKPKVDEKKVVNAITKGKSLDSQDICSIINLSDEKDTSIRKSTPNNDKEPARTPLTINKFVDDIMHNSTPMAKKSLQFSKNIDANTDDIEDITICPTDDTLIAKTTQEQQFLKEAFENQPGSFTRRPLAAKNVVEKPNTKFCIAGSCLSPAELMNLKILCFKRKWLFVEKYTPDLTHLVVSVDEENKSQRSVKFMCALASGKWIVSYKWVEKCLQTNTAVEEEEYEALDMTGEAGPRRSRLAHTKIFDGFTFCCQPPFSVLDMDTLTCILEAAGGRVVKDARLVRVASGGAPCLLLCESEHTQEDRHTYLAMNLGVVPVNMEWALNCLGGYSLCSIDEQLLCPASLLPKEVQHWPPELLANDSMNDDTE